MAFPAAQGNLTTHLTTSFTNQTCGAPGPEGGYSLPDFRSLPIPRDIYAFMINGGNATTTQAMLECCHPNLPQLADLCYLWCEVPERFTEGKDPAASGEILRAFDGCMRDRGIWYRISGLQSPSGASPLGMGRVFSVPGALVWALVVSGVLLAV